MKPSTIRIRPQPHTSCLSCPVRHDSLFKNVTQDRLPVAQRYRRTQLVLQPKNILYAEQNRPEFVFTVFEGWMALSMTTLKGRRQIIRFALPGDFIGFQADAMGRIPHSAIAIGKTILCAFPRNQLPRFFAEEPELAPRLAAMQAEELQSCQSSLLTVGRKNAEERVAYLLLELFHRVHSQSPTLVINEGQTIGFPLTQEDLGDAAGLSQIHVNRIMQSLIRKDLISYGNRSLTIHDEQALAEIAQYDTQNLSGNPLLC